MTDKLDRYTEPLLALVKESIACSPSTWDTGHLTIECDGTYMNYALKNERSEDKAEISPVLRQQCEELYVVMRKSGDWWDAAVIHFFREVDTWSYKVNFTYPSRTSVVEPQAAGAMQTRPWWKLWH